MTKIQLTLNNQETAVLQDKADLMGYDLAKYLKFFVAKLTEQSLYEERIYPMSDKMEKRYDEAMDNYKKGNVYELNQVEDLLNL